MRHTLPTPDGYSATLWTGSARYEVQVGMAGGEGEVIGTVRNIKPRGKQLWEATPSDGGDRFYAQTAKSAVEQLCQRHMNMIRRVES